MVSVLAMMGGNWVNGTDTAAKADAREVLRERLNSIKFPTVQCADATLEEAVEFIRGGINRACVCFDSFVPLPPVNIVLISGMAPSTARISLDLKDVPATETIRYIAELGGCTMTIEPHAVVLRPMQGCVDSEPVTRTYTLEPSYAKQLLAGEDAREWLSQAGVDFPEGCAASTRSHESAMQFVVKSTAARLAKIEAWLAQQSAWTPPSIAAAKAELAARAFKLDKFKASKASLQELAAYLRQQMPGINIQVQPAKEDVGAAAQPPPSITLELHDVPAWDALRYLAEMSGYRLRADEKTIRLGR